MNPEHYGVAFPIVMHWQQWFVLASALIGVLGTPYRATLALKLFGIFWTVVFLSVLWSAGFFTGGM